MKLEKVVFLPPMENQYGVISHFSTALFEALVKQGVECRWAKIEHDNPAGFINDLMDNPPTCTLSFNGLLPDQNGHFLADMIRIPHFGFLTDPPTQFIPIAQSNYTALSCIDLSYCQFLNDIPFDRVLFLPHATRADLTPSKEPPVHDILMLNSFIDYEAIADEWKQSYPKKLVEVLMHAAEETLTLPHATYIESFCEAVNREVQSGKMAIPPIADMMILLDQLSAYICGRARVEQLRSITEAKIDIYGNDYEGWDKYLDGQKNIFTHPNVSFDAAIELMRRSKIVMNCTPKIKYGSQERIFTGMAAGAAVLALATPYVHNEFVDQEEILLYTPHGPEELNEMLYTYLKDDELRKALVAKGREKVMRFHTWDQRAQTLIEELPPLLETM